MSIRASAIAAALLSGCSLFVQLDGLAGGAGDASQTDATLDALGDASPDAGGADSSSGADYRATVLADSPLAYWRLGEPAGSVQIKDETNNHHDGTVLGSALTLGLPGAIVGDPNTCARFAAGSYITIGQVFDFVGGASFSLELWANPPQIDAVRPLLAKGDYLTYQGGYAVMTAYGGFASTNPSFAFLTETYYGDGGHTEKHYTAPYSAGGVWTHWVVTFDGNDVSIYMNGQLVTVSALTPPFTQSAQPFTLGGPDDGLHGGGSYDGLLDEVAVYGTVLQPSTILHHYDVGAGLPD